MIPGVCTESPYSFLQPVIMLLLNANLDARSLYNSNKVLLKEDGCFLKNFVSVSDVI